MTKSQKVLRIFGILELVSAVLNGVDALQGAAPSWVSVVASLLAAYLLLAAAKDPKKIGGAWAILLLDLILSVFSVVLAVSGGSGEGLIGGAVSVLINLVGFIAANNVKKQVKGK